MLAPTANILWHIKFQQSQFLCTNMAPQLTVLPTRHLLVDDSLKITLTGLTRQQAVTVHSLLDEEGKKFESYSWFKADEDGKVDLSTHQSLEGTYTGELCILTSLHVFFHLC